ncbi:unnamed protein product [Ostreobium quekettii]|uniref:Uncharacterized protein n=1 Tax=Ostreobium quekettii TaxID=121088 RepID=A0A8S1IPZ1_9CHLO|nr:unnamed protein product [Ostreobium quekettii]|eukprot:evm.model.scf_58.11 EVM.evm.TU.scf_58.11   scf_58:108613-108963(-)
MEWNTIRFITGCSQRCRAKEAKLDTVQVNASLCLKSPFVHGCDGLDVCTPWVTTVLVGMNRNTPPQQGKRAAVQHDNGTAWPLAHETPSNVRRLAESLAQRHKEVDRLAGSFQFQG